MLSQIPTLASMPGLQAALNAKAALAGANFTGAIAVDNGVLTVSAPGLSLSQTWNNAVQDFTALTVNVTNAASLSGNLIDLRVDGFSRFKVEKNGAITFGTFNSNGTYLTCYGDIEVYRASKTAIHSAFGYWYLGSHGIQLGQALKYGWHDGSGAIAFDTALGRNGVGIVEFNSGVAGEFRDWKARRGTFTEYLEGPVSFEPAAPASGVRLWVNYTGGRSLLMARFATGASQVVANEP